MQVALQFFNPFSFLLSSCDYGIHFCFKHLYSIFECFVGRTLWSPASCGLQTSNETPPPREIGGGTRRGIGRVGQSAVEIFVYARKAHLVSCGFRLTLHLARRSVYRMSGKELLKRLEKEGWTVVRINGSHHILSKGSEKIILPFHGNADLKPGILNSILKKAGMK